MTNNTNNIEDELIVTIEKLASNAQGITRVNGITVFVDGVCPEDICKIKIVKKNKSYYIAKLLEVITPSKHRVKPFCPMYNVCGSCQLQHIDYNSQLKFKREIVEDLMKGLSVCVQDVEPSPQITEFRHKIQYPIRQTSVSKRILAGYFKPKSHDLVNIKYCPIQPSICDEIIDFIRNTAQKHNISGYDEKTHKGLLRHVVIRASAKDDNQLVVLVVNDNKISQTLKDFCISIYKNFSSVTGVLVNFNTQKTNLIMTENTKSVVGSEYINEVLCNTTFKIGANTFFQVNPKSADNIFKYVKQYIIDNFKEPVILDAYAGISAFGLTLADISKKVVSVEECKASVELAKEIKTENSITNIEINHADCSKFFEKEIKNNKKGYDITILDPPRKGCSKESLDYSLLLTKSKILYISCNPATLARDLKYLTEKGAKVISLKPFDMFCHSHHVETVAIISVDN